MLASSLRRLPTNDNDAAVLAGALRSAALPTVVRAASSSATPPTMALLAARLAARLVARLVGNQVDRLALRQAAAC